ncbi:carbohydrate porin [Pseudomonas sp. MWU12-2323]|uniref:Carbohydrate porin n=2 Tax=Pseudomonas TaxID=286 RepID=A0A7Y8BQC2_9PSED|nr:carbohydrate porin [Pseudomonas sp. MWU12-2323]NWB83989.1 carbohydrate porin [Pseudomonas gingeri]RBH57295.1 carbohydrate porin [Pseudomonas sp. MWU13-2860]
MESSMRAMSYHRSTQRVVLSTALACSVAWLWVAPANAAQAVPTANPSMATDDVNPADLPEADLAIKAAPAGQWTGFWTRQNMLGDIGGLRSSLAAYGVTLGLTETSEYLNNAKGGLNRGGDYDGLTTMTLKLDTLKMFGLAGGTLNISAISVHGKNLSADKLGTLQTASGIEADTGTRLWEAWYQQKFLDETLDLRVGQQSIDQEFMVSQYASTLVNTMFGWPAVPSYDMPAGGPAYPLSALGIRVRVHPTDAITVLAGVYDGNPAGTNDGDPQRQNAHGTNFDLHTGALYISELQYAVNPASLGQTETANPGLPGLYKLGAWYNTQNFADQRYGTDGLSLADPNSNGTATEHSGNYSVYAVADQMIWRQAPDSMRSVGVFTRLMGAPGDRNLISFSANAGVTLAAPFEGRDADTVSLALGYVKVGSGAAGLDLDSGNRVRNGETFLEATYQYQLTPWLQLQPDIQYTLNPGAGQNPNDPTLRMGDTLVWGLRTNITL